MRYSLFGCIGRAPLAVPFGKSFRENCNICFLCVNKRSKAARCAIPEGTAAPAGCGSDTSRGRSEPDRDLALPNPGPSRSVRAPGGNGGSGQVQPAFWRGRTQLCYFSNTRLYSTRSQQTWALTESSDFPAKRKKPAGNGPDRLTCGERAHAKTQSPAKDSGEDWRKSQDHHRPEVGSRLVRSRASRFRGDQSGIAPTAVFIARHQFIFAPQDTPSGRVTPGSAGCRYYTNRQRL